VDIFFTASYSLIKNMKVLLTGLLILIASVTLSAQLLNADSYGSKVDSVHHFKALFDIGLNIQKQVDVVFSFNTKVDLSYYYKESLFVLVGKFGLFRSGSENILNGGFAHSRIRLAKNNWIHPEFFGQYQLDGVRGMEQRTLGGGNLRFIIKEYDKGRLHTGIGVMYEYERWNYTGVPSSVVVLDKTPIENHFVKLNVYVSFTQKIKDIAKFQITAYFQARPDSYFISPRVALNGALTFNFTKHIHFSVRYNLFYDALPPVPIDQLYYSFINKLSFTF